MKHLTLDEVKNLQLQILLKFAKFCEENNLTYCLAYGTLLGAIRHNGFIPWDDDIDVLMPRPDYERFLEMTRTLSVGENLVVHNCDRTQFFNAPFTKLVDDRTDGHEAFLDKRLNTGVWIDIFPLDGMPESPSEQQKYLTMLSKKRQLLELSSRPLTFTWNPLKLAKRTFIYLYYHRYNFKTLAIELNNIAKNTYKYEDSQLVGNACFFGGSKNALPKSVYSEVILKSFENHEFNVPAKYDLVLTQCYGDYMTPPPPHKQVNLHMYSCWWKDQK